MKKRILVLCLAVMMLFTACSNKDQEKELENLKVELKEQEEKNSKLETELEEYKNSEKENATEATSSLDVESNEPLTPEQKELMDAYLEGGNSSDAVKNGLLAIEFDDNTRTYYVLYPDNTSFSNTDSVRSAALDTADTIETHIADRITVKVSYMSTKDSPLLLVRNGKIVEDNLK
ncbi:hypothetical protein LJC13_04505 [Peptostreptococcaceae bacterium OttesenSCG-928-C18]|nr:hypothetical protein [Peptostreptococcaceae bacterium OttesenSCG-928-C18]